MRDLATPALERGQVEPARRAQGAVGDGIASVLAFLGMPDIVSFNRPAGGMFLWATVRGIDTAELLKVSAEQKVVFVPGVSFYPTRDVHDGMRLNFSNSSEEKTRVGIERLAHALRQYAHLA